MEERVKLIKLKNESENTLENATLISENAIALSKHSKAGERVVSKLRHESVKCNRALVAMEETGSDVILLGLDTAAAARRNLETFAPSADHGVKLQYAGGPNKLSSGCRPQQELEGAFNMEEMKAKIRNLEDQQKTAHRGVKFLDAPSAQVKNLKPFTEKYPNVLPRKSLIDMRSISNLQSVPENAFTPSDNTSAKGLRRLMMALQKAETEDSGGNALRKAGESRSCDPLGDISGENGQE